MKKAHTLVLFAFLSVAFTACSDRGDTRTADEMDTTEETPTDVKAGIEADTAITLDPDTSIYHDMTL